MPFDAANSASFAGGSYDTLTSANNAATCMAALGDMNGARVLFQCVKDTREAVLGSVHPDTIVSIRNLASCLRALGDLEGAAPLERQAAAAEDPGPGMYMGDMDAETEAF